jgi:hypothetical protein
VLFDELKSVGLAKDPEAVSRLITQSGTFRDLRVIASSHKLRRLFTPRHVVQLYQRATEIFEWQGTHGDITSSEVRGG